MLGDPRSRAAYDRSIRSPGPLRRHLRRGGQQPPAWHAPTASLHAGAPYAGQRSGRLAGQSDPATAARRTTAAPPYETTVAAAPRTATSAAADGFGTIRVIVAVAFIASIVHWFPLILTIGAGIVIARVFARSFR